MKRIHSRALIFLLSLLVVAGAVLALLGREPTLLAIAKRVPGDDCAEASCRAITDREYIWTEQTDYVTASDPPVWSRRNLDTGRVEERVLDRCPLGSHVGVDTSPAGQWILCYSSGSSDRPAIVVNSMSGKVAQWTPLGDVYHYPILWMADSRRWISLGTVRDGYVTLYSVDKPDKPVRIPFKDYGSAIWMDFAVAGSDRLFVLDRRDRNTIPSPAGASFREYRLGRTVDFVAAHKPVPRPGADVSGFEFSPDGHRIAWTMIEHRHSPFRAILHRFNRSFAVPTEDVQSVWTSDLDGHDLREVGTAPMPDTEENGLSVGWLPNGRDLSFTRKGALFIVRAP